MSRQVDVLTLAVQALLAEPVPAGPSEAVSKSVLEEIAKMSVETRAPVDRRGSQRSKLSVSLGWAAAAAAAIVAVVAIHHVAFRERPPSPEDARVVGSGSPTSVGPPVSPAVGFPRPPPPGPGEVQLARDLLGHLRNVVVPPSGFLDIGDGILWQHQGGKYLHFSQDGPMIWLSVDEGPLTLAGVLVRDARDLEGVEEASSSFDGGLTLWSGLAPPPELLRVWYRDKVTSYVQLDPTLLSDLSVLGNLNNLKSVYLKDCVGIEDASSLSKLEKLEAIQLAGCSRLTSLPTLGTRLIRLDLSGCSSIDNLDFLRSRETLQYLSLKSCSAIRDTRPLEELVSLRYLDLSATGGVRDLSVLRGLTNLVELRLAPCRAVKDLSALAELRSLERLDLQNCPRLIDVSALAGLASLERLNLNGCDGLSDLSQIANLQRLRKVDVRHCKRLEDLSPLRGVVARGGMVLVSQRLRHQWERIRAESGQR